MSKIKIVLYGASGHTGQLVAAELVARGFAPLLAGRDRAALERAACGLEEVLSIAVAQVSDSAALRAMLEGADVLINCAGPHAETSFPLALAAIECGAHYIDTNAVEQLAAKHLFDQLADAAVQASVVLIPGMATFGGLGDLMASLVARDLSHARAVTVAYVVNGWIPTRGSMLTAAKTQGAPRLGFESGHFSVSNEPGRLSTFDFGQPFGVLDVIENYPGVEIAMIPHHVSSDEVEVHMTLSTLQEFRAIDPELAARTETTVRKLTDFTVVVEVRHDEGVRRMAVSGKDIYGFTAIILSNAIERLSKGTTKAGVLSPAQVLDADEFLTALSTQELSIDRTSSHGEATALRA